MDIQIIIKESARMLQTFFEHQAGFKLGINEKFNFTKYWDERKKELEIENSKTFTIEQLEEACKEAVANAEQFYNLETEELEEINFNTKWFKQYKAKLMGEKND